MSFDSIITRGEEALREAQEVRELLRKRAKPGDPIREKALRGAREGIDEAMLPIRSEVGRLLWSPAPAREEKRLRAISKALGRERKRLKKMQRV